MTASLMLLSLWPDVRGMRIVQRSVAYTLWSLPALICLQSAAAAEAEWLLSTKDTEIKIGIRNGAEAILELHTKGTPW